VRTVTRLVVLAGAAAILLTLTSCATPRDEGGPDPALRGQWELQSATDGGGTIPLANQLITLTIDGDRSTTGRATCSDYVAHVYGDVSSLWITASQSRVQNCGTAIQQDIQARYINDLNQVRTSTLTRGVLHLLAPGIDLQYSRALAVPLDYVVGHTWRLATVAPDSYYATANPTQQPEKGASVRFSRNGTLTGTTYCSTFTAHYVQNAGEIVVSHLVEHPRTCSVIGDSSAQTHLMLVLTSGFTFLSADGALTISSPRAELLLGFVD
jgi:heat shock protein HslJ